MCVFKISDVQINFNQSLAKDIMMVFSMDIIMFSMNNANRANSIFRHRFGANCVSIVY